MSKPATKARPDVTLNIAIPADLHNAMKAAARRQFRTLASVVRQAISEYLERAK